MADLPTIPYPKDIPHVIFWISAILLIISLVFDVKVLENIRFLKTAVIGFIFVGILWLTVGIIELASERSSQSDKDAVEAIGFIFYAFLLVIYLFIVWLTLAR